MTVDEFVARWSGATASELATAQSFVVELCELLSLPRPDPAGDGSYTFEAPVVFRHGDGTSSAGRIDCYRRGAFVLEAKKLRLGAPTKAFDDALLRARSQAENYARALPVDHGRPPFLIVVDVGNVIELYSEFSRSGATYTPFPDPRSHRIRLADLADEGVRERLRRVWLDPMQLDPARASARVTREVAAQLAALATSMESSGHLPADVAAFLTRALFSMFAEDVELLPRGSFLDLLRTHRADPATLQRMLRALWSDMDRGGFSSALAHDVLRFNGKLFKDANATGYSLLLEPAQIDRLIQAARANWREVEPSIFGTLLERALDPAERHSLGAHYTPRAYVERLVLPTVVEPLRRDWADAQAVALVLSNQANELEAGLEGLAKRAADKRRVEVETARAAAIAALRRFHHQLCTTRVLDPACGSGNFLYVTLEHMKRLEGEVLNALEALGDKQARLGLEGETVTPKQLLGIEVNPRAAALAELVLWIGFLQWHIRTRGDSAVAEPVVHDYGNIECRDAVLTWDAQELALGDPDPATGVRPLLSRWDGVTFRPHPVTGLPVPDEAAQVPQWRYVNPRKATWPQADFVVGNPPFIGKLKLREALGDGYVEALRAKWPSVPESADYVMYWWSHATDLVAQMACRQAGLITTNSLRQSFARRVVERAQANGVHLKWVIPDHPWVDSSSGAAVRIAMSVAALDTTVGTLENVVSESVGADGEHEVVLLQTRGPIQSDLTIGAALSTAVPLEANQHIANVGVIPHGAGFLLNENQAHTLRIGLTDAHAARLLRTYRNGRDLMETARGVVAIDTYGLTEYELRADAPSIWQWLHDRVKPGRDLNPRATRRLNWWRYGEDHPRVRAAIAGLRHYLVTTLTAKHRVFSLQTQDVLPDQTLIVVGTDLLQHLGIVSSQMHVLWSIAAGGTLEDRPRYNKSRCFDPFPFPSDDTGLTPTLEARIGDLAERIDAHRKRAQAAHPGVATLTGMYNVMEALRQGRALTAKERAIHDAGLVSVLRELHTELDAAVLAAYGWSDLGAGLAEGPATCTLDGEPTPAFEAARGELLTRLVALNARRAAEEATGRVRWLRPAFQDPALRAAAARASESDGGTPDGVEPSMLRNQEQLITETPGLPIDSSEISAVSAGVAAPQPWPADLPAQVRSVANLLAATPAALPIELIEARFKGRGPWKKGLPRILDTLEALGRARREGEGWRS